MTTVDSLMDWLDSQAVMGRHIEISRTITVEVRDVTGSGSSLVLAVLDAKSKIEQVHRAGLSGEPVG